MSRYKFSWMSAGRCRALAAAVIAAVMVAACSTAPQIAPADQPLTKHTMMLLGKKGMSAQAPIFVRIFKEESELEVWKQRSDGHFYHFKTYPICNWSGDLGPKLRQGDKQAPEGFYRVANHQLNPNSSFHVSFNLGYPNAYDKSLGRTGNFLMVHGKCKSAGCYAMTDALIEEIYGLAREALKAGQTSFEVHAFPFRMTAENMKRYRKSKWIGFWRTLKARLRLLRSPPRPAPSRSLRAALHCQRCYRRWPQARTGRSLPAVLSAEGRTVHATLHRTATRRRAHRSARTQDPYRTIDQSA